MSIVGTRPPLISETNLYEPRHKVMDLLQKIIGVFFCYFNRSRYLSFCTAD